MSGLSVEVAAGEVEAMIERGWGLRCRMVLAARSVVGRFDCARRWVMRFVRRGGVTSRIWLRRVVCVGGCGRTHTHRPSFLLGWRRDVVAVIGWALAEAAEGAGHRRVAGLVGVHETTLRSWLVRLRAGTERWRRRVLAVAVEFGAELARATPEFASPRLLLALVRR